MCVKWEAHFEWHCFIWKMRRKQRQETQWGRATGRLEHPDKNLNKFSICTEPYSHLNQKSEVIQIELFLLPKLNHSPKILVSLKAISLNLFFKGLFESFNQYRFNHGWYIHSNFEFSFKLFVSRIQFVVFYFHNFIFTFILLSHLELFFIIKINLFILIEY